VPRRSILATIDLNPVEHMLYLYLPVKMPHDSRVYLPPQLRFCDKVLAAAMEDAYQRLLPLFFNQWYVYLTVKTMWVTPSCPGNRPGWHADGFGSGGDLNYIWHSMNPTEFAVQKFRKVSSDDLQCLEDLSYQVDHDSIVVYPNRTLLRLDERVVHRVSPNPKEGLRTFIKVSVSKHKYNLKGNSHNYLIDYDWEMHDRVQLRNMDNKDFKDVPRITV
jgi:hypothetical protein